MIMTTEDYFAQQEGTFNLDNIIKTKNGKIKLGESADRVERHNRKFATFSETTQVISDGSGIRFNENYAGYHYEGDSLYIQSDRGHYVKIENFSVDSSVSVTFDGFNEMRFKLGYQHQQNQFTYEENVQFIGNTTGYDRIVSHSQKSELYNYSSYYDVEELNLAKSTADNTVDTRNNGLNGKVVVGGTAATTLLWDKFAGDTKFYANGRDSLNLGSTTLDDIASISFGANNQIAFTMTNQKTLTVEGNQLDHIVFGGQKIDVNYAQKSFYVKGQA